MAAIQLRGVTKRFGDFVAMRDLDLDIRDREFMALLGPSGCGKSTTMNMLAGLETPSEGSIRFGGDDVTRVPMSRRGVGFVFQNYAIFTHMNVRDNLSYGLRAQGLARADVQRRTQEIAQFLELTPFLDAPTASLSVNILQRVAIGRSAAVRPAIFLLDEPLSNVDAAFRAVMRTELRHLQRELRQTMVYVTHDQLEAMTMADRIAVMDHGVLQQVGTPLEVYNHPVNTFVATFLGSPSMNLMKATLTQEAGRTRIRLGGEEAHAPLRCPTELAAALGTRQAPEVMLGVRPEALRFTADAAALQRLAVRVDFIERVGARTILHCLCAGQALKAVAGPDCETAPGQSLDLFVRDDALRLFDAASGRSVGTSGTEACHGAH